MIPTVQPPQAISRVNEFALASGSNAASTTETAAGTLSASGGTGPYSYAISGSAPAASAP